MTKATKKNSFTFSSTAPSAAAGAAAELMAEGVSEEMVGDLTADAQSIVVTTEMSKVNQTTIFLLHGHHSTAVYRKLPAGELETEEVEDTRPPVPSRHAEFIGALFVKPEMREHILGCRAEEFARNVERFGRGRAVALYWWDIAVSIRAPLWALIKRVAAITTLADLYKRVTSGF